MSATQLHPAVTSHHTSRRPAGQSWLRVLALLLLCAVAPFVEALRLTSLSSLANSDVWWHLQTGSWMLQNHSIPHTGLFSQSSNLPWIDSSWAYDLGIAIGYKLLGLRVVPLLLMFSKAALAFVVFLLARGSRGNFFSAILLSAASQYILADRQALPLFFTILAFAVELFVLMEARRSGSARMLLWLPVLFLVWANLDPGFIYGLLVLGFLLLSTLVEQWGRRSGVAWFTNDAPGLPIATVAAVTGLSFLATLLNPYGYRNYFLAFASLEAATDKYFPDLHSIGFRRLQDYLLLLVVMAAFLALGRRRSHDVFNLGLLIGTVLLSFHRQRDCWLAVLASIAILAEAISGDHSAQELLAIREQDAWNGKREGITAAALVLAALGIIAGLAVPGNSKLLDVAGRAYPVAAANYVRDNHLPQPIFNSYEWGGFLAWYLPTYPVAIDGRKGLYGDEEVIRYFKAVNAETAPDEEPSFAAARTLILPRRSLMGQAWSNLPIFKIAYQDDVAVALLRAE